MMIKKMVISTFALYLASCTVVTPSWTYRASYNPDEINDVISIIKNVADDWSLKYSVTDKEKMQFLMHGRKSFQMFLYYEGDGIVSIVGVENVLSLMMVDFGNMSIEYLNRLKADIMNALNKRLGIKFELYEKPKKDEPYLTF